MIILLQSVTIQIRRLFDIFRIKKRRKVVLLQSVSDIKKCDRLLLQSASGITKCDSYYKVRRNRGTFKSLNFKSDNEKTHFNKPGTLHSQLIRAKSHLYFFEKEHTQRI